MPENEDEMQIENSETINAIQSVATDILIGIWWDGGTDLVYFTEPLPAVVSTNGLCDSKFAHIKRWPDAATQLGVSVEAGYSDIPRGRVLWDVASQRSVILHGSATSLERLKDVAKAFKLKNWVTATHPRYEIGDACDEPFDD